MHFSFAVSIFAVFDAENTHTLIWCDSLLWARKLKPISITLADISVGNRLSSSDSQAALN